jgi:SAM-dependent methyltransferase
VNEGRKQVENFVEFEADNYYSRNRSLNYHADVVDRIYELWTLGLDSVLEVGCSDGKRLSLIKKANPSAYVAGIDPSSKAIKNGKKRFPELELKVGTALSIPFDVKFEAVILGFFLYVCDREDLLAVVNQIDNSLQDQGTLIIFDFFSSSFRKRNYHHVDGMWSYKMDYSKLFTAFPQYELVSKTCVDDGLQESGDCNDSSLAIWILRKDITCPRFEVDT